MTLSDGSNSQRRAKLSNRQLVEINYQLTTMEVMVRFLAVCSDMVGRGEARDIGDAITRLLGEVHRITAEVSETAAKIEAARVAARQ